MGEVRLFSITAGNRSGTLALRFQGLGLGPVFTRAPGTQTETRTTNSWYHQSAYSWLVTVTPTLATCSITKRCTGSHSHHLFLCGHFQDISSSGDQTSSYGMSREVVGTSDFFHQVPGQHHAHHLVVPCGTR